MILRLICFYAVLCVASAAAADDKTRMRAAFLGQLNHSLEQLASKANLLVGYTDVAWVESGFVEPYLLFDQPYLEGLFNDRRYRLRAANIGLAELNDEQRELKMPVSWRLTVGPSSQPASAAILAYDIRLMGFPDVYLKFNASQQISHVRYRYPANPYAEDRKLVIRIVQKTLGPGGQETRVSSGELTYDMDALADDTWRSVKAPEVKVLRQFLDEITGVKSP